MQDNTYNALDPERKSILDQLFTTSEPVESGSLNEKIRLLHPKTGKMPIVLALEDENAKLREEIAGLKDEIMALKRRR